MTEDIKQLAKLREPFPANQIGKLPKGGIQRMLPKSGASTS